MKIPKTLEKYFFCSYRKDFGSKLYLFPCKNYSFLGLLFFSVFWFVKRHSFKPHGLHFQLNHECDVTGRNFHRSSNLSMFHVAHVVYAVCHGVLSLSTGKHSAYVYSFTF